MRKDIILDEAYRGIIVREEHRSVSIPMAQAVMPSLAVNAAKREHHAQRMFSQLLAELENSENILYTDCLDKAITYKIKREK